MEKDYIEEWLQAMKMVSEASVGEIPYNRTITCTITDNAEKEFGKYTVTDGSTTFEAYSDNTKYTKNKKVQVLVPNGDWSAKKMIIGSFIDEEAIITYKSPTAGIVPSKQAFFSIEEDKTLIANDDTAMIQILKEDTNYAIGEDNNILCIKADFKTQFNDYEYRMVKGDYGILVFLYSKEVKKSFILDLNNSNDMFGSIYGFLEYTPQEQSFKLPEECKDISSIEAYFYQNGNFYYIDESENESQLPKNDSANLFVNNIKIYLGGKDIALGPHLATINNLVYNPSEEEECKRIVSLSWIEKDEADETIEVSLNENDIIEWYVDTNNGALQHIKEFDGKTEVEIECIKHFAFTQVQVYVKRLENSSDNLVTHKSKVIKFENYAAKTSVIPQSDIKLRLVNQDRVDIYNCYDQNYKILTTPIILKKNDKNYYYYLDDNEKEVKVYYNENDSFFYYDENYQNKIELKPENEITHYAYIEWMSQSGTIEENFWKDSEINIKWETPIENSMILAHTEENFAPDIPDSEDSWKKLTINEQPIIFTYRISDEYSSDKIDNTIKGTLEVIPKDPNGEKLTFSVEKTIQFSYRYIQDTITDASPNSPGMEIKGIFTYINGADYLTQERTFNALTKDGQAQGMFKDGSGNIYLNASYMAAGILRSKNWKGTLQFYWRNNENELTTTDDYKYDSWEDAQAAVEEATRKQKENPDGGPYYPTWDGTWVLTPIQGTYWNLNDGQLSAKNFELNAWDGKGIYLNSENSQFKIGDSSNYMEYNNSILKIKGAIIATSLTLGEDADIDDKIATSDNIEEMKEEIKDKLDISSATGTFKWSFSPTQGINMKKGTTDVFKIDNNGLWMNGNGTFTGTITASSGNIGDWSLDSVNAYGATYGNTGIYRSGANNNNGIGFFSASGGNPALWIGYSGNTTTPYTATSDWTENTNFYVTGDGRMRAASGSISGWEFNNRYFYKNQNGQAIAFDFNALGQDYNTDSRVLGIGSFTVKPNSTGGAADWGDDVYFSVDTYGRMTIKDQSLWSSHKTKVRIDGTQIAFLNQNDAMLFGLHYDSSLNMGIVSLGANTAIYESGKYITICTDGVYKKLKWFTSGSYTYLIGVPLSTT